MIGPDKELKILKSCRLMQVTEFNTMVNSLQRFKEDLAVRALTGRKNIRGQQTQDRVFFSVLEKMLLEVSYDSPTSNASAKAAEQQLLALRKVYLWFQSNKHVLVRSDGYFPSARKITEELFEKKQKNIARRRAALGKKRKHLNISQTQLKTIDGHLKELHALKEEASSMNIDSGSSMFAPSPTQDLTSVDSATIRDKGFYEEDFDFARELVDQEYFGGNRIERLNRPMTAPPRLKKFASPMQENTDSRDMALQYGLKPTPRARPQSALNDVQHELSWAKLSPTPLSKLINKKSKVEKDAESTVKKIHITIPSEHVSGPPSAPEVITDPARIAKLVMFKEYCVQHASQQENYMRQYVNHKHGTRQHFLEFPENNTETRVRKTANLLHRRNPPKSHGAFKSKMSAYRDLSLEEFLNKDSSVTQTDDKESCNAPENMNSARSNSAPARLVMSHDNDHDGRSFSNAPENGNPHRIPKPPTEKMTVVQPKRSNVTVSSVFDLADSTGKRMNNIKEQVLSAPQHGWRYPMIPVATSDSQVPKSASGMVLALHDGDKIQHKVLIPLTAAERAKSTEPTMEDNMGDIETLNDLHARHNTPRTSLSRPKSAKSVISNGTATQLSPRPQSSPRYLSGVTAVYRQYKPGARWPTDETPDPDYYHAGVYDRGHGLRSAGTAQGPSRPRTAASWGSYPAQSEVSKSIGAASHHSTGILRHRTVAESMRVRSVAKFRDRGSNSGRSSASSYVAQLRAKQRTGGPLPVRPTAGRRKKPDHIHEVSTCEGTFPMPQLSFVSIVAPMHVPSDLTATTYAPPGGVYCGTTAVVAIATDNKGDQTGDDLDFEEVLSLEDYHSVAKTAEEQSEAEQDNWLSKWLSGGPLDGLQDASRQGGATTYADLVSRAANLDSSDERSYSDEQPSSTGAAALQVGSPDVLEFALSPRSDPSFVGRSDVDQLGVSKPPSNICNNDGLSVSTASDENTLDAASPRSSLSSVTTQNSSGVDNGSEDSRRSQTAKEDNDLPEDQDLVQIEPDQDGDFIVQESEINGNEGERGNNTTDGVDDESDVQSSSDSAIATDNMEVGLPEQEFNREQVVAEIHEAVKSVVSELILAVNVVPETATQKQTTNLDKNDSAQDIRRKGIKKNRDFTLEGIPENEQSENVEEEEQEQEEIENEEQEEEEKEEQEGDEDNSAVSTPATIEVKDQSDASYDYESECPSSGRSDRATSESSIESDREILHDGYVIRIVITSAKKVERELQKEKESIQTEEVLKEDSVAVVTDPEIPSTEYVKHVSNSADAEAEPVNSVGDDLQTAVESDSRLITREEIAAVTSLSRPASGRPIPDEKEVRDPFVEMVASTRQKQIDRSVDVQAIFSDNARAGETTNETTEQANETHTNAAVKMQRAYRHHLARTRAARKCAGISKETLEWARSYKVLLKEKSERRKQRLLDSRNSMRASGRREMQRLNRVGPHNEVYEVFHPEPELPSRELIQDSAVEIQRQVRGWLLRNKLKHIEEKIKQSGYPDMASAVSEYRGILRRTQERHGKMKPSLFLTYDELESYLDQTKKFELMFKKREFWNEMESSELPAFFNDCNLFPSQEEVTDAWDSIRKSRTMNRERKKMRSKTAMTLDDVMEVAFYIFVPQGARMETSVTRSSTWMNPVVNGEEGLKLRQHGHEGDMIEEADMKKVGHLVAKAYRDRKDIPKT